MNMPYYINKNHYKVALRKPEGTMQYLQPNQSMHLPAFYDRYRKLGLIELLPETKSTRKQISRAKSAPKDDQATKVKINAFDGVHVKPQASKIAVCLSGRAIDANYSIAYIDRLQSSHDVDVYAHLWGETKEIAQNSWSKRANGRLQTERLIKELSRIGARYQQDDFDTANLQFIQLHSYMKNAGSNMSRADTGTLSMYYSIFRANELRRASGINYDYVIRMRYDSEPKSDLDLSILDPGSINIPNEEDFAGINDQFAIGPPHLMDVYCGVYNNVAWLSAKCTHHPELLLKCQLEAYNMPIRRISYRVLIGRNRGS
jgi:hypothetical protein